MARQEIERLALFLGPGSGATGTADDLAPFPRRRAGSLAGRGGRRTPSAASSRRPTPGLRRAAAEGEGGPAAVPAPWAMHLARLRRALTLAKAGAGLAEAAKASGRVLAQRAGVPAPGPRLEPGPPRQLQPEVLDADRACKQTGSPDGLIAERLALTIAGRARRLGL